MLAITSMAGEQEPAHGVLRVVEGRHQSSDPQHRVRCRPQKHPGQRGAPGATRTDALEPVLNDDILKTMLMHTPNHRLGGPQDMANGALFPCSPAASWISGHILTDSGGGVQELD